jgi:hypothetical protein
MSKLICCVAFFVLGISMLNAQEIDQRVVKNRGNQAHESFKYNRNGYNYFLFELDKSHWIAKQTTLTQEEKAVVQPAANFKNAEGKAITLEAAQATDFNFYDYGIRLKKESRIYIALDKTHVLVFYKIPELMQLFNNSEFNVK